MRTYVRALVIADSRGRRPGEAPGLPGGRRPPLRRARGTQHPLPRGPRQVRAEQGAGPGEGPVLLDREPVPRLLPFLQLLPDGARRRFSWRTAGPRRIEDLRVGDEIIGTERRGRYRRYVRTRVLDHWSTIKPRLGGQARGRDPAADERRPPVPEPSAAGSTSTNTPRSEPDRPHLTTNNALRGHRALRRPAARDASDYKRGYLCGLIRGDGHLRELRVPVARAVAHPRHRFRLALADFEALRRAQLYLERGRRRRPREFAFCSGRRRPPRDARDPLRRAASTFETITELIRVPVARRAKDWRKGFLAGIFDAEGSLQRARCGSRNTDGVLIHWTQESLDMLGFDTVVEDYDRPNKLRTVRLRGGLKERLRFFHLDRPGDHAQAHGRGHRAEVRREAARRVDRAARDGAAALRHHDGHRRLHRRRRREPQLLRAADARVPGLQRGGGVRARDRRQGQRARGAARGAGAAVVEGRAGGAGHEHGPVPVGRGALQADARDLGGDARRAQPVLDPDEVAAACCGIWTS